jgi:quercetin dioxygenase-like cupin family protein
MRPRTTLALVGSALAAGAFAGNVLADQPGGVSTLVMAKSLFDEFKTDAKTIPADTWQAGLRTHGASDVYVVDNKFSAATATSPGGSTGWHSHPGPSLILVVSGTVTNYSGDDPTCAGHDYTAGQGFIDPAGTVHEVRNNTTSPAEDIAVQLLPQGAVRKTPQPEPANCHS